MCQFFSFVSDPVKGKFLYFNWEQRQQIISGEIKNYEADSHTSIADYYGYKGEAEDSLNKYEYNPLLKNFIVDQINGKDDSEIAEKWVNKLDFKMVVKPLIIKPIIYPFKIVPPPITEDIIVLAKNWDSVWAPVRALVRDSVRALVWDSVRASVWDSVWDSVGASVGTSVWDSVWDSVRDSVLAYMSSFFDIKYKHDFSSVIKLWEQGLVVSFDGKAYRLHGGKTVDILYSWDK